MTLQKRRSPELMGMDCGPPASGKGLVPQEHRPRMHHFQSALEPEIAKGATMTAYNRYHERAIGSLQISTWPAQDSINEDYEHDVLGRYKLNHLPPWLPVAHVSTRFLGNMMSWIPDLEVFASILGSMSYVSDTAHPLNL